MAFQDTLNLTIGPRTRIRRITDFFRRILGIQNRRVENYIHSSMVEVWEQLVAETPWWSGAAANSWNLTVDTPVFINKDFRGKTQDFYSYPTRPNVPRLPINENGTMRRKYYVTNGVPYIERLNEGWSPQAQPGWIELTIQQVLNRRRQ